MIGRCGGDEKPEWPRRTDKSRTLKKQKQKRSTNCARCPYVVEGFSSLKRQISKYEYRLYHTQCTRCELFVFYFYYYRMFLFPLRKSVNISWSIFTTINKYFFQMICKLHIMNGCIYRRYWYQDDNFIRKYNELGMCFSVRINA